MNQLPPFSVILRRALPHGQCVVVTLPDPEEGAPIPPEARQLLDPRELTFMQTLAPARRASFAGGRIALRLAAADLGVSAGQLPAILKDPRGAPTLPDCITGSISHKRQFAVGLVQAQDGQAARVGVDIEILETRAIDIGPRVLTTGERAGIAGLPDGARRLQTLCAFSLKEALYKAASPFVGRVIGFMEAEMAMPLPPPPANAGDETPVEPPLVPLTLRTPEAALVCEGAMFFWSDRVISTCRAYPSVTPR